MEEAETDASDMPARAKVRLLLIQPLEEAGLVRPPRLKVAEHEALLKRMQDHLGYLPPDLLVALSEVILRLAEGPLRNQWPAWATIWNFAVRLMPPPDSEVRILTSWFASIEGPIARSGGYVVELHQFLRRHGRPPGVHEVAKMKIEADDNRRRRARVEEWVASGAARDDDRQWLEWYLRCLSDCEALIKQGEEKRAAKGVAA